MSHTNKYHKKVQSKQEHLNKSAIFATLAIPDPTATEDYQSKLCKNQAAVELGRLGGSKNSEAQQNARRENGKKGGHPKKSG